MSKLKVNEIDTESGTTITVTTGKTVVVPSGATLDISAATLTPPAVMPASSAANLANVPGGNITYYGMLNDDGEVAIAAGHNNDLANFWDWYDQSYSPLEPAADAFRLGINFVIWSMTH